jgi:diguanylate cyclase (GGDEF)-like protein/PAS domain S-box-containing protein
MKSLRFYFLAFFFFCASTLLADTLLPSLTQSERTWLATNPTIRVGMDADYAPYEWLANGQFVGMAVDYLHLMEEKLGVRFVITEGKSWAQMIEMAKKGEIDLLTSIVQTPERLKHFTFSSPYRNTKTVIVDNGQGQFIGNLKHLASKKVAIEKGYFTQEMLTTHYPKIELVLVDSTAEALRYVMKGKADAYVGDMSAIEYAMRSYDLEGLRFSGQTEFASEHRFAFSKLSPQVASVVNKAMASITKAESDAIFNRWIGVRIQQGVKTQTLLAYGALVALLALIFGTMYYRLRQEIKHRKAMEQHYRHLTEDVLDVIWRTDKDLRITYISPSDERLRGFKAEEVIGHHVFEMFTPEGVEILKTQMQKRAQLEAEGVFMDFTRFHVQHICKDGSLIWGEILSKPERNKKGEIIGYHGITREMTEQKLLQKQVEELAFYDSLTKLPNRLLLTERLHQARLNSERQCHYNALMFLDLDNFKSLNDTHGHSMGDLLLCQAAQRLKQCVREVDTVARFGGDEFVVVLGGLHKEKELSMQYAKNIAKKISESLCAPYMLNTPECLVEHQCTASIGVVIFDAKNSEDDVLKHADSAMYDAKEAGKNTIRVWED